MAFTITFTKMDVENFQIYKIPILDGNGNQIGTELGLSLNYSLSNPDGDLKACNKIFSLTSQQKTAVLNFIKPFVQSVGTELNVTIPTWAQ
jgi:hypothetical protein